MRPAWRLAINSLSERRSRTLLLVATVALCAGLIVSVTSAMTSMQLGIKMRVDSTVGVADLRVVHVGGSTFPASIATTVASWPEIDLAVPRVAEGVTYANTRNERTTTALTYGLDPQIEYELREPRLSDGREVRADDEIALDTATAEAIEAEIGDVLEVRGWGDPIQLRVVGILERPPVAFMSKLEAFTTIGTVGRISQKPGRISIVDIRVGEDEDAEAVADKYRESLATRDGSTPTGLLLQTTERITSGLERNIESGNIGMIVAGVLAFLSAAFIIMTGLSTSVLERQRELAIVRCIGGTKGHLAGAQLIVGLGLGTAGAAIGIPMGVLVSSQMIARFPDILPGGFQLSTLGLMTSLVGAIGSGVIGALWPALRAGRTTPLRALAARADVVGRGTLALTLVIGLAGALAHVAVLTIPQNAQHVFWLDVTVGLPSLFVGYFLLAVPFTLVLSRLVAPWLSRLLRLPPGLLSRTVSATPFRHGFTTGAMMIGLALLIGIWTNGQAIVRDWLGALDFPDAFVNGTNLSEEVEQKIEDLPQVNRTCAITMQNFGTSAFGIAGVSSYKTTYIGFEPNAFFDVTRIDWIQGDRDEAIRRLNEGGAVMVAREFNVTRGISVGDTITLTYDDVPHEFDVVGVVTSPGLDIVSKFFDIGEEYVEQAVNAVFGSREDLRTKFGNDAVDLIIMSLDDAYTDEESLEAVRRASRGAGVLAVGSGREMKVEIGGFIRKSLLLFSLMGVASMLIACFGVANLIVASIQARQFEFGVLRAVGAQRGLLARLVLGEALIIALGACVLGTIMGMQVSWAGQILYQVLLGIDLSLVVPLDATSIGWVTLLVITLGAAVPATLRLMRRKPRELLAAMKG